MLSARRGKCQDGGTPKFSPGSEGCRDRGVLEQSIIYKAQEPQHRAPFCGALTTQPAELSDQYRETGRTGVGG